MPRCFDALAPIPAWAIAMLEAECAAEVAYVTLAEPRRLTSFSVAALKTIRGRFSLIMADRMGFWERTWTERNDALRRVFGDTWPSETVTAFSWSDRIRCPGACALTLPPSLGSHDSAPPRRDDWLYLSVGLSQPLDQRQADDARVAGESASAYGIEFALLTPTEVNWATSALYYFMTYQLEGENIKQGDRFPLIFHRRPGGELKIATGDWRSAGLVPEGSMRGALFWRYLFPASTLATSTGKFTILVATAITEREWGLARSSSSAHVQLLLCRAGVGQRTLPDRACLLDDPKWNAEWERIAPLSKEECQRELEFRSASVREL